jgi:hypothetical protein
VQAALEYCKETEYSEEPPLTQMEHPQGPEAPVGMIEPSRIVQPLSPLLIYLHAGAHFFHALEKRRIRAHAAPEDGIDWERGEDHDGADNSIAAAPVTACRGCEVATAKGSGFRLLIINVM